MACSKFEGNFNVTPLAEMPPLQNLLPLISEKAGTKLCIGESRAQMAETDELGGICSFHVIPCQSVRLFIIIISSGDTIYSTCLFGSYCVSHIS